MLFLYIQKQYYSASYLAQYAYLASNCYLTSDKLIKCNYYTAHQRLLSIDVFPKQDYPTDVIVDVKIGVDPKYANKDDVDFYVYISDGKYANGFGIPAPIDPMDPVTMWRESREAYSKIRKPINMVPQ